jgi:hypothetical protein
MYKSVHLEKGTFYVHMNQTGSKATKGFTHARVSFDPVAETVQFKDYPPIPMPSFASVVTAENVIPFGLVDPDGNVRKQRRDVLVKKSKDGQLYSPGITSTTPNHSRDDGWRLRVMKFRAYFTHPGVETDVPLGKTELPTWLRDSIGRQLRFRNRLAYLCAEARYACRPVDYEAFTTFLRETVLPAVDAFNDQCGRGKAKDKISAKKLRGEKVSIFHLTRFGSYLDYLERVGAPAPEGLAKKISDYSKGLKLDFKPINEFERNLQKIMSEERYLEDVTTVEEEAEDGNVRQRKVYRRLTDPAEIESRRSELELRDWEWKPVARGFASTLKQRKSMGMSFFEGWPLPSKGVRPNWGIHYYFNNGGSDASILVGKGVRAMKLEPGVSPVETGREWKESGRRARRELNPVQISFRDTLSGEVFSFRFAVLRHKFPLPDGALIKEWKLIYKKGSLWLCFVVEGKFAKPVTNSGETAALHIGWRKEGSEVWPAMLYDPSQTGREAFERVVVDLGLPPEKTQNHTPFRVNMGPSRIGRRSPYWVTVKENSTALRAEPHADDAVQVQDTWEGIELLSSWRDGRKDVFKSLLMTTLGSASKNLVKAGARTLHEIGATLTDPVLVTAYKAWAKEDMEISELITEYSNRVTARLDNGYSRIAHDICKKLSERGISTLVIQDTLLAKVAKKDPKKKKDKQKQKESEADKAILERSQKNRQHVAPALLLQKVAGLAETYGLNVKKVDNAFISRMHNDAEIECNHINPASADRLIQCEACLKMYDQDQNACRNMLEGPAAPLGDLKESEAA